MMNFLFSISTVGIAVIVGVIVLTILIIWWLIATSNTIVRLANAVDEAWSSIDISLKKRYDLIPNLVETVKGYAKHESSTLQGVIQARNNAMNAGSLDQRMQAENALSGSLRSLFALSESYPDLKANTQFLDLQRQLSGIENELSGKRTGYNSTVKTFNNKIMVFPNSIVAGIKRVSKRNFFEVDAVERENVRVSF